MNAVTAIQAKPASPTLATVHVLAKQLCMSATAVARDADVDTADALGALVAQVFDAMVVIQDATDRDAEAEAERHQAAMEEYCTRTGFQPDALDLHNGYGGFAL